MATLFVAIETVAKPWDTFPIHVQKHLLEQGQRYTHAASPATLTERFSLSPFTATIASLAMYDLERDLGAVYFVGETPGQSFQTDSYSFKQRTEQELLVDFWEGASSYDAFVTYNGRKFTLPFLYQRAAIHRVRATVEISSQRYLTKQSLPYHVDLLEEYTFNGAAPRPTLPTLCAAYGISYTPPLAGGEVMAAFNDKQFQKIAERNTATVDALRALYENWTRYLAPVAFLNTFQ